VERRAVTSRAFDYSYDVAGRLVVVEEDGAVCATCSYDDNGNRTDAVVDEQDRLLANGDVTYGWGADGALMLLLAASVAERAAYLATQWSR
jgi:hypothetical protein